MLQFFRRLPARRICKSVHDLSEIRLESVYINCFDSFFIATSTMPPKRTAAKPKAEAKTAAPEVDLAGGDQLEPPATKSRRGKAAELKTKPAAKDDAKEKEVPEKRERPIRNKKPVVVAESDPLELDAKVTKRKTKKTDEDSASKKESTTRKKKTEAATEAPKTKSRKKEKEEKDEKSEKPAPSNSTTTQWDTIDFTCTKKNQEGQKPNLKVSCWNIGGVKSWVKKNCLEFLEHEKPDILCLQETKCSEQKLPEEIKKLEAYNQYWSASSKEGYAGVGLLTKVKPLKVTYGINDPDLDEDGRCITAEYKDYYVTCVYVPNAGRKLVTLPKRLTWNTAFNDYVKALDEKKPVIICGDMNVAHNEIDLARPANNTKNAGFTKEEREGMTDFLEEGYVDTFRQLYPDKTDVYTFWTYMANARAKNVGWRLDYFIVSERLMPKVCDNVMRSEVLGSDHCPITLFINI